jgi:predicted dinucleotide-binding enzyme
VKQNESVVKKTIAIIGATDKMGTAVAKELVTGPYHLLLLGDDADCLDHLLGELNAIAPGTDAEVVHCMIDASWEADIIILAIPLCEENKIAVKIREVATGKTVISIADSDGEMTTQELKERLPYSKVIRALCAPLKEAPYVPVINGKPVSTFIGLLN